MHRGIKELSFLFSSIPKTGLSTMIFWVVDIHLSLLYREDRSETVKHASP